MNFDHDDMHRIAQRLRTNHAQLVLTAAQLDAVGDAMAAQHIILYVTETPFLKERRL